MDGSILCVLLDKPDRLSFLNHSPERRLPQILLPGALSADTGLTQRFIPQAGYLLFIALSLAEEAPTSHIVGNNWIQQLLRKNRRLTYKPDKSTFRSSSSAFKRGQVAAGAQRGSDSPGLRTRGGITINTPVVSITNPAGPSPRHASDSGLASPAAGPSSTLRPTHLPKTWFCCKGIYDETRRETLSHPSLLKACGVRQHGEVKNLAPTSAPPRRIQLRSSPLAEGFASPLDTSVSNPQTLIPVSPLSPARWAMGAAPFRTQLRASEEPGLQHNRDTGCQRGMDAAQQRNG